MYALKAWVAAFGTTVTALSAAFADDILSNNEVAGIISTVVLAIFTVIGVYQARNSGTPNTR